MSAPRFLMLALACLIVAGLSGASYDDRCCTEVFDRCQDCVSLGFFHLDVGYNDVWGCVENEYVQMDCDETRDPDEGAEPCWEAVGVVTIYSDANCNTPTGTTTNPKLYVDECYDGPTCD